MVLTDAGCACALPHSALGPPRPKRALAGARRARATTPAKVNQKKMTLSLQYNSALWRDRLRKESLATSIHHGAPWGNQREMLDFTLHSPPFTLHPSLSQINCWHTLPSTSWVRIWLEGTGPCTGRRAERALRGKSTLVVATRWPGTTRATGSTATYPSCHPAPQKHGGPLPPRQPTRFRPRLACCAATLQTTHGGARAARSALSVWPASFDCWQGRIAGRARGLAKQDAADSESADGSVRAVAGRHAQLGRV